MTIRDLTIFSKRLGFILALLLGFTAAAQAATLEEVTDFAPNPGNLQMFRYVPDHLRPHAPLVVALHGCLQSAAQFDDESGWTKMADRWGFAVVFPQQRLSNNYAGCFNWFFPFNATRGSGEVASIKAMVDRMVGDYGLNTRRVYVMGLSAGAATASNLLATYPDVFAAGAIVAGVPFGCATDVMTGLGCMQPGVDRSAADWGDAVRAASDYEGPRPRVAIWHGDQDPFVNYANAGELLDEWTNAQGIDETPDFSNTINGNPHNVYTGPHGLPLVETYQMVGMGHGLPVNPGDGYDQCGTASDYMLDVDVCAVYYIARDWRLNRAVGLEGLQRLFWWLDKLREQHQH